MAQPKLPEEEPLTGSTSLSVASQPHESPYQTGAARHRPGFQRVPSVSVDDSGLLVLNDISAEEDIGDGATASPGGGLGISGIGTPGPSRAKRVTIQSFHGTPQRTQGSAADRGAFMPSPPSIGAWSGSTQYGGYQDDRPWPSLPQHSAKQSQSSLQSIDPPSTYATSEAALLQRGGGREPMRSNREEWALQTEGRDPAPAKRTGLSLLLILLAAYSTVMSGLLLGIGLYAPRWGQHITSGGSFTISDANIVVAVLSKTVELSFVSAFVAFLGQSLSRRARKIQTYDGVTLAEMNMRNWIMQPGTLLTNWESVRYAGVSLLGILSLLACVTATLYTTACNSLVLPALKFNDWQPMAAKGLVRAQFSNPQYIESQCGTPVGLKQDDEYSASTCIQIEQAAMGFHNYFSYLGTWARIGANGNGSSDLASRPPGFAMINDNTTVAAPWINLNASNVTETFLRTGIIVNNVTMAMPHAGVLSAAADPANGIVQPVDLSGQGAYNLHASVPSPMINVLCATVNETLINPLIYASWGRDDTPNVTNASTWPDGLKYPDSYLGQQNTILGTLFNWGPQWGEHAIPPVFPVLPTPYNTLVNDTKGLNYGRQAIYLLGAAGETTSTGDPISSSGMDQPYSLCKLQVGQTPFCSTMYNVSGSGGALEAICDDFPNPAHKMQYINSLKTAPSGNATLSQDWPNIASEWARSLSLNDGFLNGNASNARLLTQLMVLKGWNGPILSPAQPSMAEALAVMAGCTLIQSSTDSPFVEFWNYTTSTANSELEPGEYQWFNASIRAQEYTSGGNDKASKAFFLVLVSVFAINVLVLAYFVLHRRWYPDFSEPQNLFNLAIQSPPSYKLDSDGKPHGEAYQVPWTLARDDGGHVIIEDYRGERRTGTMRRRLSTFADQLSESPALSWARFSPRSERT